MNKLALILITIYAIISTAIYFYKIGWRNGRNFAAKKAVEHFTNDLINSIWSNIEIK